MIARPPRVHAVEIRRGGGSGFANVSIEGEGGALVVIAERVPWELAYPLRSALDGLIEMAFRGQVQGAASEEPDGTPTQPDDLVSR